LSSYESHRHLPPGIDALCLICGRQFRSANAYIAHRFRDTLYVDPRGCATPSNITKGKI
jgi:hypothetical protein